jgi:hypothetical protein
MEGQRCDELELYILVLIFLSQKIIVKPSEYGWGAFIGEDVSEGDFISGK